MPITDSVADILVQTLNLLILIMFSYKITVILFFNVLYSYVHANTIDIKTHEGVHLIEKVSIIYIY